MFVLSPSLFSAVSALVENSGKDTNVVVFTPQFTSFLLINGNFYNYTDLSTSSTIPFDQPTLLVDLNPQQG